MEEHAGKKPFGKREWIFLIVVLVLGQLIVHMVAWRFGANVSALGYISFAGTIISIILAVLAIIYGFFQTGEQSRASTTIASQVTNLHRVVESFQKSGGVLSEQLQQLSGISAGISQAVALGEKSQEQLGKVQSSLDDMRNLVSGGATFLKAEEPKKGASIPEVADPFRQADTIAAYLQKIKVIPAMVLFSIVIANTKGERSLKTIRQKFFVDVYVQVTHPAGGLHSKAMPFFMGGYFTGVVTALPPFVSAKGDELTIVNEFAVALRTLLEKSKLEGVWGKVLDQLKQLDWEATPSGPPATPNSAAT